MSKSPTPNSQLPTPNNQLRVALVADWLTNLGGAERVVLELHRMFPEAPIYTSVYNPNGPGMEAFKDTKIRTSFIQHLPWAKTKHQLFPVLRRFAFRRFDFSDYDLVISSSGAEAKSIITDRSEVRRWKIGARKKPTPDSHLPTPNSQLPTPDSQLPTPDSQLPTPNSQLPTPNSQLPTPNNAPFHINYCHSPTHYYWVRPDEYLNSDTMGWFGKLLRFGLKFLLKPMRRWDYLAAQRPDIMIANSTLTQKRIKQYYNRDSEVIFPPVDTERFTPPANPPKRRGFVSLGRQVHYMRRDIAIKACTELSLLLRVVGRGPEQEYLRSIAGHSVEFYDDLSDEEVAEALWYAEGLISCGIEDFGITAVEALAAGCPVIALKGSGAEDIIVPSKHGQFFDEQTPESLVETLKTFNSSKYSAKALQKQAKKFSAEKFEKTINDLISKVLPSNPK